MTPLSAIVTRQQKPFIIYGVNQEDTGRGYYEVPEELTGFSLMIREI
jgi:hypothetical protein